MSLAHQIEPSAGTGLVRYEAACRAVAEAKSIDEAKDFRDKAEAMRAYARQAKNKQLELDAAEIRIRAERRLGELIAAQREAGLMATGTKGQLVGKDASGGFVCNPPEEKPITLAEAGIDKNLADRARKYAAIPEEEFNATLTEWRGRVEQENERVTVNLLAAGEKHVRGTFGTGENEWYTPEEYLEAARDVLGSIDLDPASSNTAQAKVRAGTYFTKEIDGLAREWHGRVWLNPPYAQPYIAEFVSKMVAERRSGRVTAAIMLTHNYTDTTWFHEAAGIADAICFTRGRIRFYDNNGTLAAPTQGQAFFYFGDDVEAFAARFAEIGFIVNPWHGEV